MALKGTEVQEDALSGLQVEEFCASVRGICERYGSRSKIGYLALCLCVAAGYVTGLSIVKAIRKWIRAKPGNVVFYAFYLFALPISLSFGMQAAAVAGIISPYMSMALSFGMLIGTSHALNMRPDGGKISTKASGPMVKVIAWSHFKRIIV